MAKNGIIMKILAAVVAPKMSHTSWTAMAVEGMEVFQSHHPLVETDFCG